MFEKSLELLETGISVIRDWGFWIKKRSYAKEFYRARNIKCERHYIDSSADTWNAHLQQRNNAVLAKKFSAYYIDPKVAAKFGTLFETPEKDKTDAAVIQ